MKKSLLLICLVVLALGKLSAQKSNFPPEKEEAIKILFEKYIAMGIPGLALGVYSEPTGVWTYAAGYSNLENKVPLTNQHVHYLQSVSKTYMAEAILKLYEIITNSIMESYWVILWQYCLPIKY